jgi:hypothetical protein
MSLSQTIKFRGALYHKVSHPDPVQQVNEANRLHSIVTFLSMLRRHLVAALKARPEAKDIVLQDILEELDRFLDSGSYR